MATLRNVASRLGFPVLASALAALFAAPAPARIDLGPIGGGGGPIVIGPIDPTDPGDGGGGGGGGGQTSAWLEAHGYVCRPYFDGILNGKRCETTWIQESDFTAWYEVQKCSPNDSCSRRALKTSRGKVGDNLSLWSFNFPSAPKASGLGDVDGDGDDDVIGIWDLNAAAGQVRVGLSNRVNEFSLPQLWASNFCAPLSQECTVGDFSADKKTDIVSVDRASGAVTVLTSNGTAFVSPRVWSSTFGTIPGRLLTGDFDGDGGTDLATILTANGAWGSRGTVVVALSKPGPPILTQSSAVAAAPTAPTATLQTAGVAAKVAGTAALFPGGPIGGIGGPRVFAAPAVWSGAICPDPNECVVGDFDGDLKDDVLWVRGTGESYFARSNGSAFVGQENWSDRVGRDPRAFRAADVNADGKDDLVAIRSDGGLTVGISSGAFFVANVEIDDMSCGDPQFGCRFASLDGDAYPDLVEIYPFGDSQLRPGDTFVSRGREPRGFPADPARPNPPDGDGDGVRDSADNCIAVANATQVDADLDGVGNACEQSGDLNNDGVVDLSDRLLLLLNLNKPFPAGDLDGNGVVNLADVAILDQQAAAPAPSATVLPPQIELVAPVNGTFYETGTRKVYVAGFAKNLTPENGTIAVTSPIYGGAPVTTSLAIARDGWFEGFVPIDGWTELNPIAVKGTRPSTGKFATVRAVAQVGASYAIGDLSNQSLGARIQSWQLSELAEEARQDVNLEEVEANAEGGDVKSVEITGPLSLSVRPFSDKITVDIGFPRMDVFYEDFISGCNVPMVMTGIAAHIEYDLEPRYLYPNQVAANDLENSPNVTFGTFWSGENAVCDALSDDIRGQAERAIEIALMAGDYQPGPVDGRLEDKINALDISQALTGLGIVIGTRFDRVPEDIVGVTFDMDSGYAPTSMCGGELCHPTITNATPRAMALGQAHPPFPLWMPDGGLYDVALGISPDTINQLFAAMTASGKLAELMAGTPIDLTANAASLAAQNLGKTAKLVPTSAPFLTGKPGANGVGTEVKIGQLVLEIPTLDGTDSFKVAVDLKGTLSFGLESRFHWLAPTLLKIRIHDLKLLASDPIHVPRGTDPFFFNLFKILMTPKVESQSMAIRYPLPDFGDLGLTLLSLDAKPTGGAVVYARLDPPSDGPVLDPNVVLPGGVMTQADPLGPVTDPGPAIGGGVLVEVPFLPATQLQPASGGGAPIGGVLTKQR